MIFRKSSVFIFSNRTFPVNFPIAHKRSKNIPVYFQSALQHYSDSSLRTNAWISPVEVNKILRKDEKSKEFPVGESAVRSFDTNQVAANQPIEDTKTEAYIPLRQGFLFGVFDGHAGSACAQVLANRLFHYVAACLLPDDERKKLVKTISAGEKPKILDVYGENVQFVDVLRELYAKSYLSFVSGLDSAKALSVPEAFEKAYLSLDADISREAIETESNFRLNLKTLSIAMSGSVSAAAYVEGRDLYVATVGDCQAVLGVENENQWFPKPLSIIHNAENVEEVQRILNEHPSNERDAIIKFERLFGQLAPLRAFGDVRYKWSAEELTRHVVPHFGQSVIAPHYHTPPYLTAKPDVKHHRLTPKDKFLIIGTDGLWDFLTPLQVVRMVGEHMRGRTVLTPFVLPNEKVTLGQINEALLVRKDCLGSKPVDSNACTHLIRNALSATDYGLDPMRLSQYLTLPPDVARNFRDDMSITVVYFDTDYLLQALVTNEGK